MTLRQLVGFLAVAALGFGAGVLAGRDTADRELPSTPVTDPTDPDIRALTYLQTELAASLAPLDSLGLDTLLAPDMRAIDAGDRVLDKTAAMAMLRSAQPVLLRVQDDSIEVRRYGPVAVMTLRETVTMRADSGSSLGRLRMTELWLKRRGRWQPVAGQASSLP